MNINLLAGIRGALAYQIIPSGRIACNAIVLWHLKSRDAVVVDPTDDARSVIDFVRSQDLHVHNILLTHGHFDHAADAERAIVELGSPASIHTDDLLLYRDIPYHAPLFGLSVSPRTLALGLIEDKQTIESLPQYPITALHVPGHSAGSLAFHIPDAQLLSAGDTLFRNGVGRTDLPGGSASKLAASIQLSLYSLPSDTLVIPGHGSITTLAHEKVSNPYIRAARAEPVVRE